MTPAPLECAKLAEAARIHAAAMADGLAGGAWSEETFRTLLATPGTFGWLIEGKGILLLRYSGDDSEIFTLAVTPEARRQGIARNLLETGYVALTALKVNRLLLEVAVDNLPAQALYRSQGFAVIGRRPRYYKRGAGAVDALLMERRL
jgi:[ribosomal protein S18]-alanine N-acetyltransferase